MGIFYVGLLQSQSCSVIFFLLLAILHFLVLSPQSLVLSPQSSFLVPQSWVCTPFINKSNWRTVLIYFALVMLLFCWSYNNLITKINKNVLYLYSVKRRDIGKNIASAQRKTRGRNPYDFPRAQSIVHRIFQLKS